MRAVDTNVLVRLLVRDHPEQTAEAERMVAEGAWVSHLALAECTWVLTTVFGLAPSALIIAIERLLKHRELTIQDADVVAAALDHFKRKPKLGFSDCLILEVARKAGHTPLLTFDRELAKIPGVLRL